MRINILLLVLIFAVGTVNAQERIRKLKQADDFYKAENYIQALDLYELLMSTSAGRGVMGVDAKINMADCYRKTDRIEKADVIYKEILPYQNERPDILLGYGEALLATGAYDEARSYFLQYSDKRPDDPKGPMMVKRCEDIRNIVPLYENVAITFETMANDTVSDEFAPTFYSTGVVFASDRISQSDISANWGEKERSYLDLYFSEITPAGHLTTPIPFSRKLNSGGRHDGPASFSRDGKHCYYSQSAKVSPDADKYTLQIFASHLEEGDWNSPLVLEFVTQGHMFSHPCLSANGRELYFMSDMPGGFGGTDIWVSTFQGGKWGAPRNLGAEVNTDQNEAFPFLHPGGTLYFASKGHSGYGGFDLFRARPTGNGVDWTPAENVGQPFNSALDDTYFLLSDDETTGFLASAREGSDNLYSFTIVGAEPKALPDGIAQREGSLTFIDTTNAKVSVNDEALVDSLLKAGFEVVKNDPEPKNVNGNNENPDNIENPDNNNVENPNSKDHVVNHNNPNAKDNNGNKDPNINNNWDKVNDPNDPNHNSTWANNNNTNPDPSENPKTFKDDGSLPMISEDPSKASVKLTVELMVIDETSGQALKSAKVNLRNLYNNKEENFTTDQNGYVTLVLRPDQKYLVRAEQSGYFGSSLPIATTQAYTDQKVSTKLPLIKK